MDEKSVTTYFQGFVREIIQEVSLLNSLKGCENVVNYEDHCVVEYPDVINLGIDICNALTECDRHAIVHRDIKPDNIFVSENGKYKLGDFGVSRTPEKTSGASRKGTESYMAPEIYKKQPYGKTVDLYSLELKKLQNGRIDGGAAGYQSSSPQSGAFTGQSGTIPGQSGDGLCGADHTIGIFGNQTAYQKPPVQRGKKQDDDDTFKWFLIGGLLLALFVCAMFALLILGLLAASMG